MIDYIQIISTTLIAVFTAIIGFFTGKKKRDNEATHTAFEAYNFALQSLRKEFESRIELLQKENEELRNEIKALRAKEGK